MPLTEIKLATFLAISAIEIVNLVMKDAINVMMDQTNAVNVVKDITLQIHI